MIAHLLIINNKEAELQYPAAIPKIEVSCHTVWNFAYHGF
jgi:hypothetical protein